MIVYRFLSARNAALWLAGNTILWSLSGCSLLSSQPAAINSPPPNVAAIDAAAVMPPSPSEAQDPVLLNTENSPFKPFSPDTLYSLLTAEIAGSRDHYELALDNYVQQSRETRDPQIAERATLIARYLNKTDSALETALIWLDAAPNSSDALSNVANAYLQLGQLNNAFALSVRLQDQGNEVLFQNIAANAHTLKTDAHAQLLQQFQQRLTTHPQDEQLLVGSGLLLQQEQQYAAAMTLAQQALKLHPKSFGAAALEANLLSQLGQNQEALDKTAQLLESYPHNTALRKEYARMLMHTDLALAQQQFSILTLQTPSDGDARFALGVIALEREDVTTARAAFEELLNQDQHIASAHYYLGRLAENSADSTTAILHYLQVDEGKELLPATHNLLDIFISQGDLLSAEQQLERMRAHFPAHSEALYLLHARILLQHQQTQAAEDVMSQGLATHSNSSELRFTRAMYYFERKKFDAAEQDLQHIIKRDPEHVMALNSLGYLLADQTQRFDEADALLTRALKLAPNDPSILDSMGWLRFRTGAYPEALKYLRRAIAGTSNAEINAHLGELLWEMGRKDEARQTWQEGLKLNPRDPTLEATLLRLKAEL